MQRLVKIINLQDDPQLIEEYCKVHREIWPEIKKGIKESGISNMELYLNGNTAVMIVELPETLNPDEVFSNLATFPRQQEWEEYVAKFQQCDPNSTSAQKWTPMTRIFTLK